MKNKNDMTDIRSLVDGIVNDRNWSAIIGRQKIFEFWDQAVGKDISVNAQPKVIRGDVLWVDVTDPVWMQQLHLMKEHLRQVLNDRLGEDAIKDIRFNLVSRIKPVLVPRKKEKGKPAAGKPDPTKLAEFEKMIGAIEDENARNSFRKLWLIQHNRK
jgi:predicted nucleic acid-binding Zn ribbon protein